MINKFSLIKQLIILIALIDSAILLSSCANCRIKKTSTESGNVAIFEVYGDAHCQFYFYDSSDTALRKINELVKVEIKNENRFPLRFSQSIERDIPNQDGNSFTVPVGQTLTVPRGVWLPFLVVLRVPDPTRMDRRARVTITVEGTSEVNLQNLRLESSYTPDVM